MTIQAIKSRMVKEIPEIETVHADTGAGAGADGDLGGTSSGGMSPSFPGRDDRRRRRRRRPPGPVLSGSPDLAASFSPVFRTQIAIRSSVRYLTRL